MIQLIRILPTAVQAVSRIQAIQCISRIIHSYPNVTCKLLNLNNLGQIWRILGKMAKIKKEKRFMPSFDLAKEALIDESHIVSLFENSMTKCAEFFSKLWDDLFRIGCIIVE
ncbi:hypothetical protein EVD32_01485 [Bacteroidales bacterium SW299]|nr:hypothetical protein [Bacteroidales bacterium SW299]